MRVIDVVTNWSNPLSTIVGISGANGERFRLRPIPEGGLPEQTAAFVLELRENLNFQLPGG